MNSSLTACMIVLLFHSISYSTFQGHLVLFTWHSDPPSTTDKLCNFTKFRKYLFISSKVINKNTKQDCLKNWSWWTPLVTPLQPETSPFSTTCCHLPVIYQPYNCSTNPPSPPALSVISYVAPHKRFCQYPNAGFTTIPLSRKSALTKKATSSIIIARSKSHPASC